MSAILTQHSVPLFLGTVSYQPVTCGFGQPVSFRSPSFRPTRARMTGVPLAVPQHQTQVLMFVQLLSVAQGMVFILNNFKYINPGRKKNSMVASDMIPSLGTCRDGTRRILELVRKQCKVAEHKIHSRLSEQEIGNTISFLLASKKKKW